MAVEMCPRVWWHKRDRLHLYTLLCHVIRLSGEWCCHGQAVLRGSGIQLQQQLCSVCLVRKCVIIAT